MTEGTDPRPPEEVDRRRFLDWTWKALAAGLVVEAGWTTYDILRPRPEGAFGGVVETGSTAAFPEGVPRYFVEGRFYVARIGDELVALYQKCPHLGCRVPFCESSGRFECPCHGSIFNLKGEYVTGPAPRGMDRFPITIEGDEVLVDTGTVIEGPPKGDLSMDSEPSGPSCLGEGAEQPVETPAEHVEDEAGHEGEEMP